MKLKKKTEISLGIVYFTQYSFLFHVVTLGLKQICGAILRNSARSYLAIYGIARGISNFFIMFELMFL